MTPPDKIAARDALITAACQLFAAKGYEAVSTRELAETAGVNLAAIQYHFGSKAKLFIEAVHAIMAQVGCNHADIMAQPIPSDPLLAAEVLCEFVRDYLSYLLTSKEPRACRLVFREIFGAASQDPEMFPQFIDSVVEKFIRPLDDRLIAIVSRAAPSMPEVQVKACVSSIIGQCVFYATHQPFIERLRNCDTSSIEQLRTIGACISDFSLKALGFGDQAKLINKVFSSMSICNEKRSK